MSTLVQFDPERTLDSQAVELYETGLRDNGPSADAYRLASLRMLHILNLALVHILTKPNSTHAAWQVAYAFGAPVCDGVSMTERADEIGVVRAALSKGAKEFQRAAGLPPSDFMKSEESTISYAQTRHRQLAIQ